jgi:ubiquinone/menaquinone biosynthesis C-methylase UbiE
MPQAAPAHYVMGHNDRERRRLALQASILQPFTEHLFRRAGLGPGMRVLDIGCGVGDVSLLAARLAGPEGCVVGIDFDAGALEIARSRVAEKGIAKVSFVQTGVEEYAPDHPFDAVVGRHILIHTPNPAMVLRKAFDDLRDGGVVAFHEFDFLTHHAAWPAWPLHEQIMSFFRNFFAKTPHGDVGTRLYSLLLDAGFTSPDCRAEYPIAGGPDSPFYEWMAESVRSVFPRLQAMGLASGDFDVDGLEARLRREALELGACCPAPSMVGGFARKPVTR